MRDQPRDDRDGPEADPGLGERSGDRRRARAGVGIAYPRAVRLNRFVAATGVGNRRQVESLIRNGRVTIDGVAVTDLATRVSAGQEVLVDGRTLTAARASGVLLFKPQGQPPLIVHPGELHVVMPLKIAESGAELLLGDAELARRVADPRHMQPEIREARRRLSYAGLDIEGLAPGEWRPLSPRELERLRRSVRLPPRG